MGKSRRQSEVTRDLCDLADRLTEIAIAECDVETWPGHGKSVSAMDKAERGDRYWAKQNATATIMLVKQLHNLVAQREAGQKNRLGNNPNTPGEDDSLEQQTRDAEREAAAAIRKAMAGAKKDK